MLRITTWLQRLTGGIIFGLNFSVAFYKFAIRSPPVTRRTFSKERTIEWGGLPGALLLGRFSFCYMEMDHTIMLMMHKFSSDRKRTKYRIL